MARIVFFKAMLVTLCLEQSETIGLGKMENQFLHDLEGGCGHGNGTNVINLDVRRIGFAKRSKSGDFEVLWKLSIFGPSYHGFHEFELDIMMGWVLLEDAHIEHILANCLC